MWIVYVLRNSYMCLDVISYAMIFILKEKEETNLIYTFRGCRVVVFK